MVKTLSMVFGVVFVVVAVLGFLTTGGMSMAADIGAAPRVLGLFPVNLLHNIVHLLFGIWGIMAARNVDSAYTYTRVGGIIYLVLAALGFVAPDGFGLVPLGGHAIWLHVVLGVALLAASFAPRDTTPAATGTSSA
jgi:hypothetical protein